MNCRQMMREIASVLGVVAQFHVIHSLEIGLTKTYSFMQGLYLLVWLPSPGRVCLVLSLQTHRG